MRTWTQCCVSVESAPQVGQPPASGNWGPPEATLILSAHLALEPPNGNDSHEGFVNSGIIFLHVQMYMSCLNFCA